MTALSENFGVLLAPGLRKIYQNTLASKPDYIKDLFNVIGSEKAEEKDTSIGSLGQVPEFDGSIDYDDLIKGYDKTYTHKEYAKGFQIQRRLYDDDLYGVINKRPEALALSVWTTRQTHAASVFNSAFATVLGPDGKVLCAADHPTSPDDSTNKSNAGSTALSADALEATRIAMMAWKDDRGNLLGVQPDTLIVPLGLKATAEIITKSELRPGTADNDINTQKGDWKLIVNPFLTDSTNWFVADGSRMKMMLNWFDRIKPEFAHENDFDTFIAKYRVYMRYSYGFSDWTWVYGHAVAGA
jgi:phage major head subunit gpT-like protein